MYPIVYLPIEIKHREMFSRILVASHLVDAGFAVVIGQHWAITHNRNAFPPGAYLYKSLNKIQAENMLLTQQAGHIIAANDEESLNFIERNGFLQAFYPAAADCCDLFFAQSEVQRQVVEDEYPQLRDKARFVGNPRMDVMALNLFDAHLDQMSPLQPYILFNTNFGTINSVWNQGGMINSDVAAQAGMFDGPNQDAKIEEFKAIAAWEKANNKAMTSVIAWVLQHLNINVVIRPHPAERPDYWTNLFSNNPRVTVIRKSDPHPWIAAAKIVVHCGCTTGLETSMLRRAAINLLPTDHPSCDRIVSYVNPTFRRWEDAAEALRDYVLHERGAVADFKDRTEAALSEYFPGARDAQSAPKMAAALADALRARGAQLPLSPPQMRAPLGMLPVTDIQREKFSSSPQEFMNALNMVNQRVGINTPMRVETLLEDVYVITRR